MTTPQRNTTQNDTNQTEPANNTMPPGIAKLAGRFDKALKKLEETDNFARISYQNDVFQLAEMLMASKEGMLALLERAPRFEQAGVFEGGPWADPSKLQAPFISGSIRVGGVGTIVEVLSELRILAIAEGKAQSTITAAHARMFLEEALALNMEFIVSNGSTEAQRNEIGVWREFAERLFQLLADAIGMNAIREKVLNEIEQISAQRPLVTAPIQRLIMMVKDIPTDEDRSEDDSLNIFYQALTGPSPLARIHPDLMVYREQLRQGCSEQDLHEEASIFAQAMMKTGLVSRQHAVLVRHLRAQAPHLLPVALHLNDVGTAEFEQNKSQALQLIRSCIFPATAQSIYGFGRFLEQGLLSRQEISVGIMRLLELDIMPEVRDTLLASCGHREGVTANTLLVSGLMSVFGQPLGVGQGNNPTCQAARAISLWAQHAHGYLLEILISAARDGFIEMNFEGQVLRSDQLIGGVMSKEMDTDLDSISVVLTPHLDRLYDAMMQRVALRHEDGHRWVNPALYGRWVPRGFASVFSYPGSNIIKNYDEFIRRFFASHHPSYNDGHGLMYPNPVGILVTNIHGDYLGPHAISIQRVETDPQNNLRVYFYNPNNEGRQDWGMGVKPSVSGCGALEGESSLPFEEFASRLYAFHYNPYEEGEAWAVPMEQIRRIEEAAKASWGKSFQWELQNNPLI